MHPSCPDYDLCENCEAAPNTIHPNNHPMLKIKTPLRVNFKSSYSQKSRSFRGPGFGFGVAEAADQDKLTGELSVRPSRHGHHHHHRNKQDKAAHAHGDAFGKRKGGGWCQHKEASPSPALAKYVSEIFIPANEVEEVQDVQQAQQVKGKGKEKEMESEPVTPKAENKEFILPASAAAASAEATPVSIADDPAPAPADKSSPPAKEPVGPLDIFSFVRHVTIPPGTSLPAGTVFTKIWKYTHFASGSEYPFSTVRLVRQTDDDGSLGGIQIEGSEVKVEFKVDDVKEGEEGEVRIEGLKVPDKKGEEVREAWRFVDENGVEYGQPFRLR